MKAKEFKKIIIIGAGENAQIVANILAYQAENKIIGFLDDNKRGQDILGKISDYVNYNKKDYYFFVSFGNGQLRKKFYLRLKRDKVKFINAIHPTTWIEKKVELGENVMVGAFSYININTKIGDNTIINNGCLIEHDNKIGKHCQLTPGIVTGGGVTIAEGVYVGLGTIIRDHIVIAKNCLIGMDSNVVKNTTADSVYYGNPAKFIKKINE